jgi:type VI secretion system protein ImpE
MTAKELFDAGRVKDAASSLAAFLREHPTDVKARTFLFELLCFSGQYERAEKQLSVLAEGSKEHELGAVLYYSALHAEKLRHELFRKQDFPKEQAAPSPKGTLNGKPFESIRDLDPQIGARLEVYAAGAYIWVPFEHIKSIDIQPVRRLRDTLWTPAFVMTGPSFKGADMGEVIIPAIYPFSWNSSDESVWLGRSTEWVADEDGTEFPVGQKAFIVDGEEIPLLEVRSIEFATDEKIATDATA